MSVFLIGVVVVGAIVVGVILWGVGLYNGLVRSRNRYRNAFAQIDVQLRRRYDLIPNLVETAKTFMKHERETLEAVIQARNVASQARDVAASGNPNPEAVQNLAKAEGGLSGVLGRLFALSESYPELRSNQNMMQLSEELTSTENKVGFARQAYNDSVTAYNTARELFPTSLVAGTLGFGSAVLFEVAEAKERERVDVSFD